MQRRRGLALLLVALLAGQAAAAGTVLEHKAAAISGLREAHEAAVSGLREKHEVVVSGLRAKLFHKQLFAQPPPTAVSGGPVPTAAGALTPTAVPAECASVAEVATQAGNFTALLAAAQAAGLAPALSDRSLRATVFAPTDEAFVEALDTLGVTSAQLLAAPELLQAILKYHVVPGESLTAGQLSTGDKLPTLLAADIANAAAAQPAAAWHEKGSSQDKGETGELTINVQQVYSLHPKSASRRVVVVGSLSQATVVVPDVNAGCPAVVHVVDAVLLPDLAPKAEEETTAGSMWGGLLKLWGM